MAQTNCKSRDSRGLKLVWAIENYGGPHSVLLHTQAKGHDHVVVRALDSHPKTTPLTCFI